MIKLKCKRGMIFFTSMQKIQVRVLNTSCAPCVKMTAVYIVRPDAKKQLFFQHVWRMSTPDLGCTQQTLHGETLFTTMTLTLCMNAFQPQNITLWLEGWWEWKHTKHVFQCAKWKFMFGSEHNLHDFWIVVWEIFDNLEWECGDRRFIRTGTGSQWRGWWVDYQCVAEHNEQNRI